jgi:hypothetical protein
MLEKLKQHKRLATIIAAIAVAVAAFLGSEMTLQQAVDHVLQGSGIADVKVEEAK